MERRKVWEKFTCQNPECGWTTYGTFFPGQEILPDTDCPKCGFHDSVVSDDGDHPEPADLDALRADQVSAERS